MRTAPTKKRRSRAGYTLIEVLMAIGVLAAGSVAIMAMHQAATRGNMEARQMTTGNQAAQRWIERLRRDALNWTQSNNTANPTLLVRTSYLRSVPSPGTAPLWFVPSPPATTGETANFDFYGRDLVSGGGAPYYCSNVRLEWIHPGQSMRADVRVWWVRRFGGSEALPTSTAALANCAPGLNPNTLTGDRRVRMVYATTVIRFTPPPGT